MVSKAEVRALAAEMGLVVAEKPDSQDICFVPTGTYAGIVEKFRPEALEAGEIVTEDGAVLGLHQGIARYTVGQAKGLGNAAQRAGEPIAVKRIEPGTRRIVVGPRGVGRPRGAAARRELADRSAGRAPCAPPRNCARATGCTRPRSPVTVPAPSSPWTNPPWPPPARRRCFMTAHASWAAGSSSKEKKAAAF